MPSLVSEGYANHGSRQPIHRLIPDLEFNTLKPELYDRHFADDMFKSLYLFKAGLEVFN